MSSTGGELKVRHQLSRLEPMVLHPLDGVDENDWHRAPAGKWNLAQIVEHLAITIDMVATGFEHCVDKPVMRRSATPAQSVLRHMLLGGGKLPRGLKAFETSLPSEAPDPELVAARFRMGVERTRELVEDWPEQRTLEVFLRHPVLGDLNLPEWVRFHYVHCGLHGEEIGERLEWLWQ